MKPIDPRHSGSTATLHDICSECGVEIIVEVDTNTLKPGEVWVTRRCKTCAEKQVWNYE